MMMTKPQILIDKYQRMRINRRERINKLEDEIEDIRKLSFKQEMILSDRITQKQKRCKHDYEDTRKSWNARDDASFEFWVFCKKCDADIGCIEFGGKFRRWDHD